MTSRSSAGPVPFLGGWGLRGRVGTSIVPGAGASDAVLRGMRSPPRGGGGARCEKVRRRQDGVAKLRIFALASAAEVCRKVRLRSCAGGYEPPGSLEVESSRKTSEPEQCLTVDVT